MLLQCPLEPWAKAMRTALLTGAASVAAAMVHIVMYNVPFCTASSKNLVAGPKMRLNPPCSAMNELVEGMVRASCAFWMPISAMYQWLMLSPPQ